VGPQLAARIHGYSQTEHAITITEANASNNLLAYNASTITGTSGSPVYSGTTLWGVHTSASHLSFGVGLFDPILEFIYTTFLVKGGKGFVQPMAPSDFG
jgi:V8-like Glu-specific endopeptidase